MVRRLEQTNENKNDEYSRYQETTPRKREPNINRRYEVGRSSLQSLQSSVQAKFIVVYTNGEKYIHDKPIHISFSRKKFPHLHSLLDEIARGKERINRTLVRYLYKWPSGEEVLDIGDIDKDEETNVYVCSDVKRLYKSAKYGGLEFGSSGVAAEAADKQSRNSKNSRKGLLQSVRGPINITVISNTNRQSKQSLFVDPQSKQPFEEILRNVTEMLNMDNPPCKALYSFKPPYRKVDSISSFNRIVQTLGDIFLACGTEGKPIEKSFRTPRDASPMRNNNSQKQKTDKVRHYETNDTSRSREYPRYKGQDIHEKGVKDEDSYVHEQSPQHKDNSRVRQPPSNRQRQTEDKPSPARKESKLDSRRRTEAEQSPKREEITDNNLNDQDDNPYTTRQENNRDVEQEQSIQKKSDEEQFTTKKEKRNSDRQEHFNQNDDKHQTTPKRHEDQEEAKHSIRDNYDDDGNISKKDYPSEEEMLKRIGEMEKARKDLDKDIEY